MRPNDEVLAAWLDGQLPEAEAATVAAAVAADPLLAGQVERMRSNDALLRAAIPLDECLPAALVARLGLAEPVAEANVVDFAAERARRSQPEQRSGGWTMSRWRVAAQFLLIAGVGSLMAVQFIPHSDPTRGKADYRALGSGKAMPSANSLVMFKPGVDAARMQQVLSSVDAKIVDGPSAAKAWRVMVPTHARDAALKQLRSLPEISMAEPIDGVVQ